MTQNGHQYNMSHFGDFEDKISSNMEDFFGMAEGADTDNIRDRSTRREDMLPVLNETQKVAIGENLPKRTPGARSDANKKAKAKA